MAAGNVIKEFSEEATCSICLDYFRDPVITECGHNFCRACLAQSWGEPGRYASCPQCRQPAQPGSLRPNRQLANIVELSKKFSLQVAKGAGDVCKKHQELLKLFCRDDGALICVVCDRSKEHRQHRVLPVEEAAEKYKVKLQAHLPFLKEDRGKLMQQKEAEEQRIQTCLKQVKEQRQEFMSVLERICRYFHEKEHFWSRQLAGLEEEIKKKHKGSMRRLSKEISHFSDLIRDVELQCQQPPNEFLQDIRRNLSRCRELRAREELELSPELEWRLRNNTPKISVLKKAMQNLEGSLTEGLSKVSVTLDPVTAHPRLVMSEDLKNVRGGSSNQNLPGNPERFNAMPCVLGCERFTSERHFWEVEVEKLKGRELWAVGVARESLRRKGWIHLSLPEGIWAVGKDSSHPFEGLAYTSPVPTPVALRGEPRKIRVFLDYEEGRVEFFNADTDSLIFAFPPASFSGEGIRPFFLMQEGTCMQWKGLQEK